MNRAASALLGFTLITAVAVPAPTGADDVVPVQSEPPAYRGLVDQGLREFALMNFEEARALFRQAHRLFPNARTHRALALAEFELKNYAESIVRMEQALTSQVRPLTAQHRIEALDLLARAYRFVTRAQITIHPPEATLFVDGVEAKANPYRALLLNLGHHELSVAAECYVPWERDLVAQGGDDVVLDV